ncbi:MAG: GNAT family N-acetyltransferase [Cytophagales bacterium]|nr:MAG: GNAT family N-acetyltransferase [Cytophagales bacterium]
MSFRIRLATSADAALISEVGKEAFYAAFAPDNTEEDMQMYLESAYYPEKQLAELQDPANRFLLLEKDQVPIGFAKIMASKLSDNEVDIDDTEFLDKNLLLISKIYLLPQFVGKGIGNLLMNECVLIAQDEGFEGIWLCVWQKNERAIKFYEKYELKKIGMTTFLLGKDKQYDLVMAKLF